MSPEELEKVVARCDTEPYHYFERHYIQRLWSLTDDDLDALTKKLATHGMLRHAVFVAVYASTPKPRPTPRAAFAQWDKTACGDCGTIPGMKHLRGCDIERCPRCGNQAIGCDCIYEVCGMDPKSLEKDHPNVFFNGPTAEMYAAWDAAWESNREIWTGEWPGSAEAREFGFYHRHTPGGWERCGPEAKGAEPDVCRLSADAPWDASVGRHVLATRNRN